MLCVLGLPTAMEPLAPVAPSSTMERVAAAVEALPRPISVDVYNDGSWLDRAIVELASARSVYIASYVYDHPGIQAELCKRLRGEAPCQCRVLVDHWQALHGPSADMNKYLHALASHDGALVRVAKGRGRGGEGNMHLKAFVLNGATVYMGSANLTNAAAGKNWEQVVRITGSPVVEILKGLNEIWDSPSTKVFL